MNPLLGTVDGWTSTVRSSRWSPLVIAPVVASASLLWVAAASQPDPVRTGLVGETGLALSAVAGAFIADDLTAQAAPATPLGAGARLAARAAFMVPLTIVGWLLVLAVYASVAPSFSADLAQRALSGLALACAALAFAAVAGRFRSVMSPGALGVAAMATLGLVLTTVPARWLAHLPSGEVLRPVTILVGLLVVVAATQEPASF